MLFGCFVFWSSFGWSQKVIVSDIDTHNPIVNVAVYTKDLSKIALTDFYGTFDISIFSNTERITFKKAGYEAFSTTKKQILKQGASVLLIVLPKQLDEVVMSISKWEQQKKDIPNKIAAISAKDIAFSTPQTAADLLQNSGKIFVQKSQLGGGSPMIRGFATNRVLISVDGVRMNNAIFRGGNVQNVIAIDPFTIHNTEIVFGPGSVIYGSDAIGGVMNFYTKSPSFSQDNNVAITGEANYRTASANSENTFNTSIGIGKKKWGSLTNITHSTFQDLKMGTGGPSAYLRNRYVVRKQGVDTIITNPNPRAQVPSGYTQLNLMQKLYYKPSNTLDLRGAVYYSKTSDYARYDRLERPSNDGVGFKHAQWYYGPQKWFMSNIKMHHKEDGLFYDGLKISAAYQRFEESRNSRDFGATSLKSTSENVDAFHLNIDFENKRTNKIGLYYGGSYLFNKVQASGEIKNIETNEERTAASRYPDGSTWQSAAAYISGEYKPNATITFLGGLRYSHIWANAVFDETFYDFPFDYATLNTGAVTGSLGFSWFPKKSLQITGNAATGFRAPNIDDLSKIFDTEPRAVVVPNPSLKPEYAYNIEFGIQKNIENSVVLKSALFYTHLADALIRRNYTFNGAQQIVYNGELSIVQAIQNAAKVYTYGAEFSLDAMVTKHWSLITNITYSKGQEKEENGTITAARHVVPLFGDFHVLWKNQQLKADFFIQYNGAIAYNNLALSERSKPYIYTQDTNGNPYAPAWYTINFRSSYSFKNHYRCSLNLENMTNNRYRTYSSGISAPGINFILGLGYSF